MLNISLLPPTDMAFENLVDMLFALLRQQNISPNRKWVKLALHKLGVESVDSYRHLLQEQNPQFISRETSRRFQSSYFEVIAGMGSRRNTFSIAESPLAT